MCHIVVAPDLLLGAGLANASDHRVVVGRIRQNEAIGHQLGDGRDPGCIGDVAGGEDDRRRLAVEIGKLALELDQRMVGSGDVTRAARPCAHAGRGLDHRTDDLGMLSHAHVIAGAPDDHLPWPLPRVPDRVREARGDAFEIREDAVATFVPQPCDRVGKEILIGHDLSPGPSGNVLAPAKAPRARAAGRQWVQPHSLGEWRHPPPRRVTISELPCCCARPTAVLPALSFSAALAPCAISSLPTAVRPKSAAIMRAVCPTLLAALTSQCSVSSRSAILLSPLNETPIRALLPLGSVAQGSAPLAIRKSTACGCSLYAARISGLNPCGSPSLGFTPALIIPSRRSTRPPRAASK